jgi:hypothetical protein
MAFTLQRKMFKMGGVAHGGGVTSGLKLNKGGSVTTPIGVGSGKQPMKMGPDGKMREGHFVPVAALPYLFAGGRTALGALRAARGGQGIMKGLSNFFKVKPTGKIGSSIKTMKPGSTTQVQTIRSGPQLLKESGGIKTLGMSPDRLRQIAKIGAAGLGGSAAVGGISSLLPAFQDSPDDTLLENILDPIRSVTESAFDVATGLPVMGAQAPFRKLDDIQGASGVIRSALYGDEKKKISDSDTDKPQQKIIEAEEQTQEQESAARLADLQDRSEAYLKLLNDEQGSNRLGDIGLAISAAAPGLLAEDYGQAAAAYGETLGGRLDAERAADRELTLAAKQLAIGDMQKDEEREYQSKAAMDQLMTAAMLEGDPTTQIRAQKLLNIASEIGVENITELPVKANGKIDEGKLKRSMVYTDVEKLSGKTFLSINKNGEPDYFDNFLEAQQHASS